LNSLSKDERSYNHLDNYRKPLQLQPANRLKMNFSRATKQPILSICIPTFNRSSQLNNLLASIAAIPCKQRLFVELCISDNCSSDHTAQIIGKWSKLLRLRVVTQLMNIGATRNFTEVTLMASGKWILVIGDDDEVIPEQFGILLKFLSNCKANDWVLIGVKAGDQNLLGDLKAGSYDVQEFRKEVIRTGLFRFGFIGSHIFPSKLVKDLTSFSTRECESWPHVALFLMHLYSGSLKVYSEIVVVQAAGGGAAFFCIGDWVITNLKKLIILSEIGKRYDRKKLFFYLLMFRELYSMKSLKDTVLWRVLESRDFRTRGVIEFFGRYALFGPFIGVCVFHFVFILILFFTPPSFIKLGLWITRRSSMFNKYNEQKVLMEKYNSLSRGV
jgi:glycosyltransferase involved in cell wall biosynthesis